MEPFEDENPFSTPDPPLSSASSNSHVDVSSPSSPVNHNGTLPTSPPHLTIQAPPLRGGFSSPGSGHGPPSKGDFCCVRGQWLHSGEDVEIVVRVYPFFSTSIVFF
jgi:sorting nexin-41/42